MRIYVHFFSPIFLCGVVCRNTQHSLISYQEIVVVVDESFSKVGYEEKIIGLCSHEHNLVSKYHTWP